MRRILVLGAGGMLGHKVCQGLLGHEVIGTVRRPASTYEEHAEIFQKTKLIGDVDVLDDEALEATVRSVKPDWIVNCVGIVKQLEEAQDPSLSVAINSLLPHRLAALCERVGARLVHISTDCVFDGVRGSYTELDLPNARDLYGKSKALGETLSSETSAVTLRTSFIGRELGASTHGLVEWFLAQAGGVVDGFSRVIYSGLTALELANVIGWIVGRDMRLSGVYQVASQPIAKADLLELIRRVYQVETEIRNVDEPVSDRSLVMAAFTEATDYRAPSWAKMIEQMHSDPTPYADRVKKRSEA